MKVKKILHIDDEAYEVDGIREALTEKGFEVEPFAWPDAAEDPAKEGSYTVLPEFGKYDLILLDVIMGPGDLGRIKTDEGYTSGLVFHRKKIVPEFPHKPVFFVSALPDGHFKAKAKAYAQEHGLPYIGKTGEAVNDILRYIMELEAKPEPAGKETT